MSFSTSVLSVEVPYGDVFMYWLGQAGFAFKTTGGRIIFIDPYLTDSVYESTKREMGYGFKRVSAPLFSPGELQPDYLLITHEHGDHLDTEAAPGLADPLRTVFVGNEKTMSIMEETGAKFKKAFVVNSGKTIKFDGFSVTATMANHGKLAPGALGFVLDFGCAKVYYSGDTCFDPVVISGAAAMSPDIALLPINGEFGNLNGTEAAEFAEKLGCRICVPHHFWTFPLHRGDPMEAIGAFEKLENRCALKFLTPGEQVSLRNALEEAPAVSGEKTEG